MILLDDIKVASLDGAMHGCSVVLVSCVHIHSELSNAIFHHLLPPVVRRQNENRYRKFDTTALERLCGVHVTVFTNPNTQQKNV